MEVLQVAVAHLVVRLRTLRNFLPAALGAGSGDSRHGTLGAEFRSRCN